MTACSLVITTVPLSDVTIDNLWKANAIYDAVLFLTVPSSTIPWLLSPEFDPQKTVALVFPSRSTNPSSKPWWCWLLEDSTAPLPPLCLHMFRGSHSAKRPLSSRVPTKNLSEKLRWRFRIAAVLHLFFLVRLLLLRLIYTLSSSC
jgi:hypothetical protein